MDRLVSTAAIAAWSGYHHASAFGILAAAAGLGQPFAAPMPGLSWPEPSLAGYAAASLCAGHLALGVAHAGAAARIRRTPERAERRVLVALAAGSGLTAGAFFLGASAGQAGTYASCLAATLLALGFDRMVAPGEEFDETPTVREGIRIAAQLGDRPSGACTDQREPGH